jgi:GTP-binding protein Era
VAIVSDKPQTTRHRIHAVVDGDGYQLVLVDLPGFQRPRDPLTERMQERVDRSLADVDAVLFVLAADEAIGAGDRFIAERVFRAAVPVFIVVNKTDRRAPEEIAAQIAAAAALGDFQALHPVSALTGDGIVALRDDLAAVLPEGPRYFPAGERSDAPVEQRIAELVREKALALTREEIPHAIAVEVEAVDARTVSATLIVETRSQKQIVVGKGGSIIKQIGMRSRPEIEHLLGHPVYLDLRVKVRPKWRRDEALLERLGL